MLRPEDFVARFGGDEFVVFQRDIRSNDAAANQLQQILKYHLINAQVDASKIRGAKGPVNTVENTPVTLDGSNYRIAVQNLANGSVQVLSKGRQDESPSFAPNGAMIIYSGQEGGRSALATVSTDGLTGQRLKSNQGEVREPVWGPFTQ